MSAPSRGMGSLYLGYDCMAMTGYVWCLLSMAVMSGMSGALCAAM
nr:hypothetical protein Q903MT_gene538 [Picea sitchensis]